MMTCRSVEDIQARIRCRAVRSIYTVQNCPTKSDISIQGQYVSDWRRSGPRKQGTPRILVVTTLAVASGVVVCADLVLVGVLVANKIIARPMTVSVDPSGLGKTWCQSTKSLNPTYLPRPGDLTLALCYAVCCAALC